MTENKFQFLSSSAYLTRTQRILQNAVWVNRNRSGIGFSNKVMQENVRTEQRVRRRLFEDVCNQPSYLTSTPKVSKKSTVHSSLLSTKMSPISTKPEVKYLAVEKPKSDAKIRDQYARLLTTSHARPVPQAAIHHQSEGIDPMTVSTAVATTETGLEIDAVAASPAEDTDAVTVSTAVATTETGLEIDAVAASPAEDIDAVTVSTAVATTETGLEIDSVAASPAEDTDAVTVSTAVTTPASFVMQKDVDHKIAEILLEMNASSVQYDVQMVNVMEAMHEITDGFISSTQDHSSDVGDRYETLDCESVDSAQIYFVHEAGCEVITVGSGGQSDVCYIDVLTQTEMNQPVENTTISNVNERKVEIPQMNLVQLNDLSMLVSDGGLSSSEQGFMHLVSGEISTVNETDQNRGRSRKRPRQEATWTRTVNKICRNMGMAYVNKTGKLQRARTPSNFTYCCRKKCTEIVSEEDRKTVFDQFWSLGSWELQTSFILSSVQNVMVKRRKRNGKNSRKCNYLFMLNRHRVCRKFFCQSLDISNSRLHRALLRKQDIVPSAKDGRGKHASRRRLPDEQLEAVRIHINMVPKYTSHYSRSKNPDRLYLNPGLNMSDLYRLYCEFCKERKIQPVKKWAYVKVFNSEFNIAFKKPSTDTCSTCDRLKCAADAAVHDEIRKQSLLAKELHLRKADSARSSYQQDAEAVKSAPNSVCIVFDLQKTLPTPKIQTSKVFYMRQLWTYNLNIHDCKTGKGNMYMWHEGTASRGSQEIASCLLKFCQNLPPNITKLVAYSDCCGGQNRNENIAVNWLKIVRFTHIEEVEHKFFEPGHSYNACDQDFGIIEKKARRTPYVWTPADWFAEVSASSRNFTVTEMKPNDFLSLDEFKKTLTVRKKAVDGWPVSWQTMKYMRVTKSSENMIEFKTSLCEDAEVRMVSFAKNGGRICPESRQNSVQPLYIEPRKLKAAKLKDLINLLAFVPAEYHSFYYALTSDEDDCNVLDHPDIVDSDVDE